MSDTDDVRTGNDQAIDGRVIQAFRENRGEVGTETMSATATISPSTEPAKIWAVVNERMSHFAGIGTPAIAPRTPTTSVSPRPRRTTHPSRLDRSNSVRAYQRSSPVRHFPKPIRPTEVKAHRASS